MRATATVNTPSAKTLHDDRVARDFYDARYESGYMDAWPAWKRARVVEVVRALGLPPSGSVLDFGCGTGIFTDVLRHALPGWEIVGSDLSPVALDTARRRFPHCRFVELAEHNVHALGPFDFLFTHHVLEHVPNLSAVCAQMAGLVKAGARMLHILPCGNPGSLEHTICTLRVHGIDTLGDGRFFFEDEGHLRRLTTSALAAALSPYGFVLETQFYANQYDGAVEWMTATARDWIKMFTDPGSALDADARRCLKRWRRRLLTVNILRRPPSFLLRGGEWRLGKERKSARDWVILIAGNPLSLFAPLVDRALREAADREWQCRKNDPAGSEMYLGFRRTETVSP